MVPFGRLLGQSYPDPSPPSGWLFQVSGSGSSYLYADRAWAGRANDENARAYLFLPVALGSAYRLSFYSNDSIGYGLFFGAENSAVVSRPGLNQLTFRLSSGNNRVFLYTQGVGSVAASGIVLEQIG